MIVLLETDSIGQAAHLHCNVKGFLNQINGGPTKETSESLPIMLTGFDSMCFRLRLMSIEIHLVNIPNASIHDQTIIQYCIHKVLSYYDGLLLVEVINMMVNDGRIPVRITSPDNMRFSLPFRVIVEAT